MDLSKMLVTGGIFAAIAAGWTQLKAWFAYISRFLILRSNVINESMGMAVVEHLKANWKAVPDGLFTFTGSWHSLKGRTTHVLIPFRVTNQNSIWYRKVGKRYQVVFLKSSASSITMSGLRGFIDFTTLIKEALHLWDVRRGLSLETTRPDRHHLVRVMGSEKGLSSMADMARTRRVDKDTESPVGGDNSSYIGGHPNLDYDDPMLHSRADFQQAETQDPFEPLYYSDTVLQVVDDCQQWLDSASWYLKRSIPWRRGVLLHGPGGTGKSSLALATARKLKLPVYQFFLATLSDQEFINEWSNMGTPCVVLFEDFDNVFVGRESQTIHKSLTFDCILNMLSGVSSVNGILLFITTNHIEKLDPALGVSSEAQNSGEDVVISTRPGRIDQVVYLGMASRECRVHIASRCLSDWPEDIEKVVSDHPNVSPTQFQEQCVTHALHRKRAMAVLPPSVVSG